MDRHFPANDPDMRETVPETVIGEIQAIFIALCLRISLSILRLPPVA